MWSMLVCMPVWKPEADIGFLPLLFSTLYFRDGFSHSTWSTLSLPAYLASGSQGCSCGHLLNAGITGRIIIPGFLPQC